MAQELSGEKLKRVGFMVARHLVHHSMTVSCIGFTV